MQQPTFLAKLYEIKPFKIVDSPQGAKRQQLQQPSSCQLPPPPILSLHSIPSATSNNYSSESSSLPSLNTLKPLCHNVPKNTLGNYNFNSTQPIVIQNYAQKSNRKYSGHELKSSQTYMTIQNPAKNQQPNLALSSPLKTPNKQNKFPLGTMIQSHLYTSLSSSIDTLFSKIEKIKKQFDCPNSANKSHQDSYSKQRTNQNRSNKSSGNRNQKFKMVTLENENKISQYSPILKHSTSNDLSIENGFSSMSSISPFLQTMNNATLIRDVNRNAKNQNRESYKKNVVLVNNMYRPSSEKQKKQAMSDVESIQSFDPVGLPLPATLTNNMGDTSSKTKTIIDQINLLLQSSKKNNQSNQLKIKQGDNKYDSKYKKVKTFQEIPVCDIQSSNQFSKNNKNVGKANKKGPQNQYDQFDDQFITIKLKATQSEYTPNLTQHNMSKAGNNKSSTDKAAKDNGLNNISYKICQPFYSQPCINEESSQSSKINDTSVCSILYQCYPKDQKANTSSLHKISMAEFELGKCVGSGKFGDVHICKHKATGWVFALKKVFKSTIIQYGMIQQFTRELKIHYTLSNSNPNITKLYTHFQDEYHIFLLMEYIEDGTLMPHLKRQEQFVSNTILQVLNAVQYLHRNKIAHRDLKPENILLTHGVVKLCDFGWSSQFTDEMKKTFCGTLDYVSPQMKDKGQYTTSVDLWSIGVLTFELLAGFAPYKKQIDRWKIMGARIKDKWRWDVIYPPQISDCARKFIQGLLKENPDQRATIRQCRNQQFITKYNHRGAENRLGSQIQRLLG